MQSKMLRFKATHGQMNATRPHPGLNDRRRRIPTLEGLEIRTLLTAAGTNITAIEGQLLLNAQVATFSDPQTTGMVGDYSATINWGDNLTSAGVISATGGTGFAVLGSHTYAEEGPEAIKVTINGPNATTFTANSQAVVADAPLHASNAAFVAVAGTPFTGVVATFSDEDPGGTVSDYRAVIEWGDGQTSSVATVTDSGKGSFAVMGGNTYAKAGTYTVKVTVIDSGGSQTSTSANVNVAGSPTLATGAIGIAATEGQTFTGSVATFSADGSPSAGNFQATIHWGDGAISPGSVVVTGSGTSATGTVTGSHRYAEEGNYEATTTIDGPGGLVLTTVAQVKVADAPLTVNPIVVRPASGTVFTGVVASLVDANPLAQASDYYAVIDWGDGHTSDGQVTPNQHGGFNISGSNIYAKQQTYTITVHVNDTGGQSATSTGQAFVGGNVNYLTGRIAPDSISGPNKALNITNVDRPTFQGTAAPFALVQVFAVKASTKPTLTLTLGQTLAGPDGNWSLTPVKLSDGVYTVSAAMTSTVGSASNPATSFPTTPVPLVTLANPLVISTSAPRVAGMVYQSQSGQVTVVFQATGPGIDQSTLRNPANFTLVPRKSLIGRHTARSPHVVPSISGFYTTANAVKLQFSGPLAPGHYLFQVTAGGVTDLAGNALDGEFTSGRFPSGNGRAGGNFVAQLNVPALHPTPHVGRLTRRSRR